VLAKSGRLKHGMTADRRPVAVTNRRIGGGGRIGGDHPGDINDASSTVSGIELWCYSRQCVDVVTYQYSSGIGVMFQY